MAAVPRLSERDCTLNAEVGSTKVLARRDGINEEGGPRGPDTTCTVGQTTDLKYI